MVSRKRPSNPDPNEVTGCLVLADIVGFSKKRQEEQLAVVRALDQALVAEAKALKLGLAASYLNCTGDGFLFCLPPGKSGPKPHESALALCLGILRRTSLSDPAFSVRFGIHTGPYREPTSLFAGRHSIGRALNDVSRVAGLGDGNHIVVSEAFFQSGEGTPWTQRFVREALDVAVKHNVVVRVRILDAIATEPKLISPVTPYRFAVGRCIDERIHDHLAELCRMFPKWLRVGRQELNIRASIFLPDETPEQLPTDLICVFRSAGLRRVAPGRTRYRIDPPQGLPGRAHERGGSAAVWCLPPPSKRKAYVNAWADYSIDENDISTWSNRPRSMFVIPFRTAGPKQEPSGVVCLDSPEPIEKTSVDQVVSALRKAKHFVDETIAWTMLTRRSI